MNTTSAVRLKRGDGEYLYEPFGLTIRKAKIGGRHTAVGFAWWEIVPDDDTYTSVFAQSLEDVRRFIEALEDRR